MSDLQQNKRMVSPDREDFISCLAETIAESHQTSQGIDLDAILSESSIELWAKSFKEPFDGLLVKDEQGYRVICNLAKGNSPTSSRGRFTIAHELGHYFIDEHRTALEGFLMPSLGEKAIKDNEMEREADLFASHLLLPTQLIRKAFKKTGIGMEGIQKIASNFRVSMKCAAIRFIREDMIPCCISFRNWEGNLKWNWFSRKAWLSGMRKVYEEPVDKGATNQVFTKGPDQETTVLDSAATARYYFHMGDGQNLNEIFHEEAMSLGEYGVLTLLSAQNHDLPSMVDVLDHRYSRSG